MKQHMHKLFGVFLLTLSLTACGQATAVTDPVLPVAALSLDEVTVTPNTDGEYETQAVVTNNSTETLSYVNYHFAVEDKMIFLEIVDGIAPGETKTTSVDRGPSSGEVAELELQGLTVTGLEAGIEVTVMQDYVKDKTWTISQPNKITDLDYSADAEKITPVAYEIVAGNELPSKVQEWVQRRQHEQGTDGFNDRESGFTYLLISYGETLSATAEIQLQAFERQGDSSLITYNFINEGNESAEVRTPTLVVRVPLQNGWRTDFKQVSE